jgi:hypothetical protein
MSANRGDSPTTPRVLAEGVLQLDPSAPTFTGARAVVRLEEVTYADVEATPLAETVIEDVNHRAGAAERIPFRLQGIAPPSTIRAAAVRVHVDVDGDGAISPGDLISRERYLVCIVGAREHTEAALHPHSLVVEALLYPL